MDQVERPESDADFKSHSCLACRQRKVKCDRHHPCSNCVKTARPCSFVAPVRGKRRRTKVPKEGLHAKLRRYEELLKSHGADIEASEYGDDSGSETASPPNVGRTEKPGAHSNAISDSFSIDDIKPRLIDKEGSSRYFDRYLLSNLGGEFPYPEEDGIAESTHEAKVHETDLLLDSPGQAVLASDAQNNTESLANLHPPYHILLKLWDVYKDRVDPFLKILHLPTFWSSLKSAFEDPQDVSKSLEALICAFYLATVASLGGDECQNLLGGLKSAIFTRFEHAARRALGSAGFLHTSSPMTLQAYVMFLLAVRSHQRSDTLFVLSGIAVRLALKMGLHRDGSSLGLSPFQTELRRRLWWHIVHLEFRISDLMGAKPSMDLFSGDTKMPLNVEDEALSPDMVDFPPETDGITSIVVCLIRCEITELVRKDILTNPDVTIAKKDAVVKQLEDLFKRKYLRYCDPTNTLHQLASIMVRSGMCRVKLFAHNPRRNGNRGAKVPRNERDVIFTNATKLLEYVNLVRGNASLEKYMWQAGTSLLWNSLLHVLVEVRYRKVGPEVDRVWQLIGVVLSKHPQIFEENTSAVYKALGKWTLEAWDDCHAADTSEGSPCPPTPGFINELRCCRTTSVETPPNLKGLTHPALVTEESGGFFNSQPQKHGEDTLFEFEPFASYDIPNLYSLEMNPEEWVQWDNLVVGEGWGQTNVM